MVEFYSGVRAHLPISEMSEAFVSDATEHFRLGQTVKVWVLSVDEPEQQMRVSLKDQSYWSKGGSSAFDALEEGSIVSATVSAKFTDKILVNIAVGDISLKGVISVIHLADTPGSKSEKKLNKFQEGSKLKHVVVLSKNVEKRTVFCSLKPSIVEAVKEGTLPSKYEDLYRGRKVTGWVKNIEDFGCFIGFAGDVEGRVNKSVGI